MHNYSAQAATVRAATPVCAPVAARAQSRMVPPCSGLSPAPKLAPTQRKTPRSRRVTLPLLAAASSNGNGGSQQQPEGASFDRPDVVAGPSCQQPLGTSLGFSPNTGVIRGSSFIIKRNAASASPETSALAPVPPGGLQLHPSFGAGGPMVPYDVTRTMVMVDETQASLVEEVDTDSGATDKAVMRRVEEHEVEVLLPGDDQHDEDERGATFPPTSCTGIVPVPSEGLAGVAGANQDTGDEAPIDSSSPRRTHRLRFTCNMCGSVNTKPINPHAWGSGTVFARCCGCGIVHRLIDHLNVVDEIVYRNEDEASPQPSASPQGQSPGLAAVPSGGTGVGAGSVGVPLGLPPLPMVVGDLLVPEDLGVPEPEDPRLN